MRLACREDFEERGGLYWPPYQDFPYFRERAEYLFRHHRRKRVLIAGCGWGFTVQHARSLGVECWGVDVSPYALAHKQDSHVVYGDITDASEMPDLDVDIVFTEDVYPMLTPDEIGQAQEVLHGYGEVIHWITPSTHPSIQTKWLGLEWVDALAPDRVFIIGGA